MVHTVRRVCVVAMAVWAWSTAIAVAQTARVTLLPAGQRASVVVEIDDLMTGATAIEATDDRTVEVEVGPVRGKVINQLLQAAAESALVSHVRVRGITRGAEGTVVTIQVTGKVPISGSVRRAARRIYIDLAPLDSIRPLDAESVRPAALPERSTPAVASAAPKTTPPSPPPSKLPGTEAPLTAAGSGPSATTNRPPQPRTPVATASTSGPKGESSPPRVVVRNEAVPTPAPRPGPAAPTTPVPAAGAGASTPTAGALARTGTPTSSPLAGAPPRADRPSVGGVGASALAIETETRAERLARLPDVKGVEKLKADLLVKRKGLANDAPAAAELDALIAKVDQYVLEAQRNRLAADAALFRNENQPAAPAPADQLAGARALRPQLEEIARAVGGWNGGPAPQELYTLSATLPKLRGLHLPAKMTEAHSVLCNSLEGLAVVWTRLDAEPVAPGTEFLPPAVARARAALDTFLSLERSLSRQPNAQ